MKKSHLDYEVPNELCTCEWTHEQDKFMRAYRLVRHECFRCTVMRIQRERHRRIETGLVWTYCVLNISIILFHFGFERGWW